MNMVSLKQPCNQIQEISKRNSCYVTNKNIAPSEVTDSVEDERVDAFRGIPKLIRLSLP